MVQKLVAVEVPEGMRLGKSKDSGAGSRGLLFDEKTNKLVRHAELFDVDEDPAGSQIDDPPPKRPSDSVDPLQAIALALKFVEIVIEVAPVAHRFWVDTGAPAVANAKAKRKAKRVAKAGSKATVQVATTPSTVVDIGRSPLPTAAVPAAPHGLPVRIDAPGMTTVEAQQRLAQALLAFAFAQEQMSDLHRAVIIDGQESPELEASLAALSPDAVEQAVQVLLANNPDTSQDAVGSEGIRIVSPLP